MPPHELQIVMAMLEAATDLVERLETDWRAERNPDSRMRLKVARDLQAQLAAAVDASMRRVIVH